MLILFFEYFNVVFVGNKREDVRVRRKVLSSFCRRGGRRETQKTRVPCLSREMECFLIGVSKQKKMVRFRRVSFISSSRGKVI
mmetsp:Transcript_2097/g.2813  ORF Transcript_2097/g.2813 Transcript_2097/m.2813 type:complete len:83 (-) Transcript_2097:14-262(-)